LLFYRFGFGFDFDFSTGNDCIIVDWVRVLIIDLGSGQTGAVGAGLTAHSHFFRVNVVSDAVQFAVAPLGTDVLLSPSHQLTKFFGISQRDLSQNISLAQFDRWEFLA
jgi:hypothetical protein